MLVLDNNFVLHWHLLVEALYILLKHEITTIEIDDADALLYQFVAETEILYSSMSMGYNVHLLLHVGKKFLNQGP